MKKPITVGTRSFASKKEATVATQRVLYSRPIGSHVFGDDLQFLLDLLQMHPEFEEKIGCGIKSIEVEQNGPTRGFWITRLDGSRTDWSFIACLTPPTAEKQALAAFRTAIRGQIQNFKDEFFAEREFDLCPITGEKVTRDNCHVDHAPPGLFVDLVDHFVSCSGLKLAEVLVVPTTDGATETRLLDAQLDREWREYHAFNAKLRVVSRTANLSFLRRGVQ